MKRLLLPIAVALAVVSANTAAFGQDAATAAAIADRQAAEERYNRLNAAVEDLLAANVVLQRRLAAQEVEIRSLKEENARQSGRFVSYEDLRKLAEKVQEIDAKREADKRLILDEINKLAKVAAAPPPVVRSTPPPPAPSAPRSEQKGYEHTVQKGEFLLTIINAYNAALKERGVSARITLDQVLTANPGLNPDRLVVGQKVFIPDPTQ